MKLDLILYYLGILLSYLLYIWVLISGIYDYMSNNYNIQLTILIIIAMIASFMKLPKSFLGKTGTLREQILFSGVFTIQTLGLILNVLAFRNKYEYLSYIFVILIVIIYIIAALIFIPRFKFFKY